MRKRLQTRFLQALIVGCLVTLSAVAAYGQASFIQITDPHIFDDTWKDEDNRLSDKSALASCMNQINDRVTAGQHYDFVVVTGDLGIEALLKPVDRKDDKLVAQTLKRGAADLASMLDLSKVKQWLFVPGNNDVLDEMPENVRYYNEFIKALTEALKASNSTVSVTDLCPTDDSGSGKKYFSRSYVFKINDYAFIGFNDASFKNSSEEAGTTSKRIELYADAQRNYAHQVRELLNGSDFKYAYIFYHIPEIDDPYLVTLTPDDEKLKARFADKALIGNSFFDSAWFVKNDVRDEWNQVVRNPRVKGLFAGHFHDRKQQTYEDFKWLRTRDYPGETLAKLHVCPPLALKLQRGQPEEARGFREVYLDKEGEVSSRIFWLNQSQWGLGPESVAADAQLELGKAYEANNHFKEAEAAYAKAAESKWPPTRERALSSLQQVVNKEPSAVDKYLFTPIREAWISGVSALGATLPTIAAIIVFVLLLWYPIKWYGNHKGRDRLRIGPIVDSPRRGLGAGFEQLIAMVHGRMRVHYARRVMIDGLSELPMLAKSQSAEVAEVIEAVLPSGFGKVAVWLMGQTDKPEYNISGTIQVMSQNRAEVFLALHGAGKTLKTWHRQTAKDQLVERELELTFEVLKKLVKYKNEF